MKGTAYVARLFIGFLSESERESLLNPLRRTVNEAKESRSEQFGCGCLEPGFSEVWLYGSTLIALSFSSLLVERNAGAGQHN